MLSSLQHRVASLLATLPESEGFALAGGAALILRGAVDRPTRDLDFFTADAAAVDRLVPVLEAALLDAGFGVQRIRVNAGFARLAVSAGDERSEVDLCVDFRALPTEPSPIGPTLALEELAANKLLALFSRAEARDFVDLAALEPRFGLEHLCDLAADKDAGFSRPVLAEMLGSIDRLPADEFGLGPGELVALRAAVAGWRLKLPPPPGRRRLSPPRGR